MVSDLDAILDVLKTDSICHSLNNLSDWWINTKYIVNMIKKSDATLLSMVHFFLNIIIIISGA